MKFAALIIGDEILSGRRSDKHLAKLIELLGARGLKLSWARYAGDDFARLPSGRTGRYSRMPLIEGLRSTILIVLSDHAHPWVVRMPRSFQSVRIRYSDSPASTR